ncbi:MAG: type IX secretion system sortase PorU [Muribaculaceae bacterium]
MPHHIIRHLFIVCSLSLVASSASALTSAYYASESKLASGRWVKISADTEGIYQISYDTLRQWGFDDPAKVAVYGYGGTALDDHSLLNKPDDIQQTALMHTADGRLIFYSDGVARLMVNTITSDGTLDRNYYSSHAYFLLSDAETPKAPETIDYEAATRVNALKLHVHADFYENEEQNPAHAGAFFHEKPITAGTTRDFTFSVRDYYAPGVVEGVRYDRGSFRYYAALSCATLTQFTADCPDVSPMTSSVSNESATTLGTSYAYAPCKGIYPFTPGAADLVAGSDITFHVTLPASAQVTYAAIDRAQLIYPRLNVMHADEPTLIMSFPATVLGQKFYVSEASGDLQIWNVTTPCAIKAYQSIYDAELRTMTCTFEASYPVKSQTAARIIAFEPEGTFPEPEYVGDIANTNIHADATPHMAIITTATYADQARELAQIHHDLQGLDVNVYISDDIINEFGGSTPHVMAYRRLAKMFYDRSPSKFKHILFYGPTSYDNRGIVVKPTDRLLCFETEVQNSAKDNTASYCSDAYFAMLNDTFTFANLTSSTTQVNVGRLPIRNTQEAADVNDKIRTYLSQLPTADVFANIITSSDDGDGRGHIKNAEEAATAMLSTNPDLSVIRIHDGCYTLVSGKAVLCQKAIAEALMRGVGYMTYSGHGGGTAICLEDMWDSPLCNATQYAPRGLMVLASCDLFTFDREVPSLARDLVFKKEGGAMGVIAAGRSVYMEHNQSGNVAWSRAYAAASPSTTIGDIFRIGRNSMLSTGASDSRDINTLCYNLCGDPALPIGGPTYKVSINSINGVATTTDNVATVAPLSQVTITGYILNNDGSICTSYNGNVKLDIYDGPYSVAVRNESNLVAGAPATITLDEKILTSAMATVSDGVFTAKVIIPAPSIPSVSNRILATARADNGATALGHSDAMIVSGYDAQAAAELDTTAPRIDAMYIDGPSFCDGDIISPDAILYAEITPSPTGICFSSRGPIAGAPTAVIDGVTAIDGVGSYISVDAAAGTALLRYPLTGLTDGEHSIALTITNNAGTQTSADISFRVVSTPINAAIAIAEATARTKASFDLRHDVPGDFTSTIIIENADGTTARRITNASFPYEWDLTDDDGNAVTDGLYNVFALIKAGRKLGATPKASLVVIK